MENGSGLKTDQRQHGKNRETKRATAAAVYCAQAASLPQAACPSPRHQRFRRYSGGSITGGVQVAVPERARAKRRASMRRFSAARSRGTVRFASATLTPGLRRRGGIGGRAMMLPPYGGIFAASRLLDLLRLCVMCVCVLSARACSGGKAGRLAKTGGGGVLLLRVRLCDCDCGSSARAGDMDTNVARPRSPSALLRLPIFSLSLDVGRFSCSPASPSPSRGRVPVATLVR